MRNPTTLPITLLLMLTFHGALFAQDASPARPQAPKPAAGNPADDVAQTPSKEPEVFLKQVFKGARLPKALFFTTAPGDPNRAYVLAQDGQIYTFLIADQVKDVQVALSLGSQTRAGGEEGLLGIAFHPDFAKNRKLYLQFTAGDQPRRNIIAQFTANADGTSFDAKSRRDILTIAQPYSNHNGGMLAFGPDKMLYIGSGDGGAAHDPQNHGQRLDSLLGKILRIDIDNKDKDLQYSIPKDNPFINTPGVKPEIWAYGLRNPWRFSFDSKTGELWAGDVGQNEWEEISIITKAGNFGWRIVEGTHKHRDSNTKPTGDLIPPVYEYSHKVGQSVTGGYVYRGKAIPDLQGAYLFADYASGLVWALRRVEGSPPKVWQIGKMSNISSFGQDADGEVYVVSIFGNIARITKTPEQ